MATWGQTNPPVNRRRRVALMAAALLAVPISVLGALGLLRSGVHGAALASSGLALASGSPAPRAAPQTEQSAPVSTASTPIVEPNREAASTPPTVSAASAPPAVSPASSAAHAAVPAATSARPRSAPLHTLLHAATAAPPPVVAKPSPSPVKNPLKMSIQ